MRTALSIIFVFGYTLACSAQTPVHSETVLLNGLDTYYEVYGEGEPLFLLHGFTQTTSDWKEYVDDFSGHFKVYLVDLLGHGKSSPLKEDFSLQRASDHFLDLLNYLQLDHVKAIGLSYGAELLLQFTSSHAERIDAMIIIGGTYHFPRRDFGLSLETINPDWRAQLKAGHAHGEGQIRNLLQQIDNYEILLTQEDVQKISSQTLVVVGERDNMIDLDATLKLHELLPRSHLWIVPNKGHRAHTGKAKPEFVRIAQEFLNGAWEKE